MHPARPVGGWNIDGTQLNLPLGIPKGFGEATTASEGLPDPHELEDEHSIFQHGRCRI